MRRLIIDLYPSTDKLGRFDILINGEELGRFDILIKGEAEEGLTAYGVQKVVEAEISKAIESLD